MLQRIQTIYLFIAFIATGVLPFVFPLWVTGIDENYYFIRDLAFVVLFAFSTTLTIISIMTFKKRKKTVCHGQAEYNIKFNFIRVIYL
jgi:hypothetical protein